MLRPINVKRSMSKWTFVVVVLKPELHYGVQDEPRTSNLQNLNPYLIILARPLDLEACLTLTHPR